MGWGPKFCCIQCVFLCFTGRAATWHLLIITVTSFSKRTHHLPFDISVSSLESNQTISWSVLHVPLRLGFCILCFCFSSPCAMSLCRSYPTLAPVAVSSTSQMTMSSSLKQSSTRRQSSCRSCFLATTWFVHFFPPFCQGVNFSLFW